MKITIMVLSIIFLAGSISPFVSAQNVPEWVKNNAAWWSEGTISEDEFVSAIQFLIKENILIVPETSMAEENTPQGVPEWVKNNAKWWADGIITEGEFLNGIQHLIKIGILHVTLGQSETHSQSSGSDHSELDSLQAELDACSEIKRAYERIQCEKEVEQKITRHQYKTTGSAYKVGPVTYYYAGNEFEMSQQGQAYLTVKILAVNTDSDSNVTLMCFGPAVCNYDVTNGDKVFKYSSTDFTSGNITLKPDQAREFEIFFGPNIGYGGTTFEYDSSKEYFFRINESFGSASIPLNLS